MDSFPYAQWKIHQIQCVELSSLNPFLLMLSVQFLVNQNGSVESFVFLFAGRVGIVVFVVISVFIVSMVGFQNNARNHHKRNEPQIVSCFIRANN